MKKTVFLIAIFSILTLLLPTKPILAFNPNLIISDEELANPFSLDLNGIQKVLERGALKNTITTDIDGRDRYVSDIIWRTAQNNHVSPKFLLVLIQKEQGLVEDDNPQQEEMDWATGYGICDSCNHEEPTAQRWRGFAKQLNSASLQFSDGYIPDIEKFGKTVAGFGPGIKKLVDGVNVTPTNAATAALYSYTPHIQGNSNFVRIWNKYFSLAYPNGTLLKDNETEDVYVIQAGAKRKFGSKAVLFSYFPKSIILPAESASLQAYDEGAEINYANYSLLKSPDGAIYLLVNDTLRHISSPEAFRKIGFNPDEVIDVSSEEISYYKIGEPISEGSESPVGDLVQDQTTGGIYFVESGVKHPLLSKEILQTRFGAKKAILKTQKELELIPRGTPLNFPEGSLVKEAGKPSVYVISEGFRRPIPNEKVFLEMGWLWNQVVETNENSIALHPLGDDIRIIDQDEVMSATL